MIFLKNFLPNLFFVNFFYKFYQTKRHATVIFFYPICMLKLKAIKIKTRCRRTNDGLCSTKNKNKSVINNNNNKSMCNNERVLVIIDQGIKKKVSSFFIKSLKNMYVRQIKFVWYQVRCYNVRLWVDFNDFLKEFKRFLQKIVKYFNFSYSHRFTFHNNKL